MARLSGEQWEQARAEYEVRGVSLGEVAKRFGVSDVAVGKRARKEQGEQGKSSGIVDKKVLAIKGLCKVEQQSSDLPQTVRTTLVPFFAFVRIGRSGGAEPDAECHARVAFAQRGTEDHERTGYQRTRRKGRPKAHRGGGCGQGSGLSARVRHQEL